jgi:hypothetical protein
MLRNFHNKNYMMVYIYNPSYSGGTNRRIMSLRLAAKSSKTLSQKRKK